MTRAFETDLLDREFCVWNGHVSYVTDNCLNLDYLRYSQLMQCG